MGDLFRKSPPVFEVLGRGFRARFVSMIGLAIIASMLEAFSIAAIIPVISIVLDPEALSSNRIVSSLLEPLGNPTGETLIFVMLVALAVLFFAKNLVLTAVTWLQTRFRESVEAHVSTRLFQSYLNRPYEWICTTPSAVLLRNLNESRAVVDYSIGPRIVLTTEGSISLCLFLILVYLEPLGSLLVMATVGLGGFIFILFSRSFIRNLGIQKTEGDARRIQIAQEALMGVKELRIYGVTQLATKRYETANNRRIEADQRYVFASSLPVYWLEIVLVVSLAVLIIALTKLGRTTDEVVSFMALFAASAFRILPSANRVVVALQALKFGRRQLSVILGDLQDDVPAWTEPQRPTHVPDTVSRNVSESTVVQLDDVSFTYGGLGKPVLDQIDLTISKGSRIGLIGASGSGKSTLLSIVAGLLEPRKGAVTRRLAPGEMIRIGYVSQDPYIVEGSISENIRFGSDVSLKSEEELAALLARLGLDGLELDRHLKEQGRSLSGGQKQRISIARALAHDPDLLILDEPTSAVDENTERQVIDTLRVLPSECAVIVVTHRRAILDLCDEVYELIEGRLTRRDR